MLERVCGYRLVLLFMVMSIAACGGGGGEQDSSSQQGASIQQGGSTQQESNTVAAMTDSDVQLTVQQSNISRFDIMPNAGTFRWVGVNGAAPEIPVYIPTAVDAIQMDLASKVRVAIADINRKSGNRIALTEVSSLPSASGYFRVSYLTSYVPPGSTDYASYCANVATGPSIGTVIQPNFTTHEFNGAIAWINLGNGYCDVSQDIVTHELGHALGLAGHFDGFGDGSAISANFWDVLTTLYSNPVKTPSSQLSVTRATS